MSKHRADIRPRWGRIIATALSAAVVLVALLGAVGFLREGTSTALDPAAGVAARGTDTSVAAQSAPDDASSPTYADGAGAAPTDPTTAAGGSTEAPDTTGDTRGASPSTSRDHARRIDHDTTLPTDSGEGRRAVFSESRQRVWLVDEDGTVERTYLVSGSVTDNLAPGTYSVYSRSENAWGIDDSGTMKWFVRFAHGANAAIGFHDIPVKDGEPLQTRKQLGTPQSHGCIRQKEADALAMWDFAQLGTTVVVTA